MEFLWWLHGSGGYRHRAAIMQPLGMQTMETTHTQHTAGPVDRMIDSMDRVGSNACVGLDPVLSRLPSDIDQSNPVAAIAEFSLRVVEAVSPHVACLKVQSACYERFAAAGVAVIDDILREADARSLPVILDAKRGDIGISATHYAAAAFDRPGANPDWLTVNAWLGTETIEPYLECGGVFVLVRTSNPGSAQVQGLELADGRRMCEAMADLVADMSQKRIGKSKWSDVGAVVGATHASEAESLRDRMPGVMLLVPGIGAQGGRVEDCAPLCGDDGHGALLTASRSVIYAEPRAGESWTDAVSRAATSLAEETGRVARLR
jgi:orotidine-5'-phosphate decarboxylase